LVVIFLAMALGATGVHHVDKPELSFDESRFLAVETPSRTAAIASRPSEDHAIMVDDSEAGRRFAAARELANADHMDLGEMPPPPSQFSFRELLTLSRSPGSSSSSSSEESSESGAKKSDKFIQDLIANMKFTAAVDDPDKEQALVDALSAIKDEIVYKANTIKKNKEWVKKVHYLVQIYVKKIRRVDEHLKKLINGARILLHKKKQIQNMIKERKLEKRLKLVRADLDVVHAALQNVKSGTKMFNGRTRDVKQTIGLMEATLKEMRTKERKQEKKELEKKLHGEESSEESSEESGSSIS